MCHAQVPRIHSGIGARRGETMRRAVRCACTLGAAVYATIGVAGFFTFARRGQRTPQDITTCFGGAAISCLRCAVVLPAVCSYAINFFPVRDAVFSLLGVGRGGEVGWAPWAAVTVCLDAAALLVARFFSKELGTFNSYR
eukprot:gene10032-6103_t